MTDLPRVILVDIDGTVALRGTAEGARSPYDWDRVGEDHPNPVVIEVVQRLASTGLGVVYVSGRDAVCERATWWWLNEHVGVDPKELLMRPAGDNRPDYLVKREMYEAHIRDRYDVLCVLDDRDQVVKMWRDLDLTVLQVAEGDF